MVCMSRAMVFSEKESVFLLDYGLVSVSSVGLWRRSLAVEYGDGE